MLARLLRSDGGNSATEMAVTLPVLLLLLMVIIEAMSTVWINSAMESGLRAASRLGLTGWAPEGKDRRQAILDILDRRTLGLVNARTATVETKVYGDFQQIGMPEPFDDTGSVNGIWDPGEDFVDVNGNGTWDADMGRDGLGGPGEVVVYTVSYRSPFLTPLQRWIGGDGWTLLRASAVVRNEPWG